MQLETGQIQIGYGLGRVEPGEDIAQLRRMLGRYTARVVVFVKTF